MTEEDGEGERVVRVGDEVVVSKANEERTKFGECCALKLCCFEFLLIVKSQIGKVLLLLRRLVREDEKSMIQYSSIVCQKLNYSCS